MGSLKHQACGVLDLASAARCADRALLSKHSNQNEKPDLGQESDAHDRDRKEHVARRERVHECLAPSEAPGVNHSGEKMFRFQTQTARDASGGLFFIMAQQPTGPPVYEVQSSKGWTDDALIFVFRHVIFVQPMLDLHQYRRAGEQDLSHPENMMAP